MPTYAEWLEQQFQAYRNAFIKSATDAFEAWTGSDQPSPPAPPPGPIDYRNATIGLIEKFEGFTPNAKWDVNAYRLGFGSDTKGKDQIPVTQGMVTSRAEAIDNLMARLTQFETRIITQIGQRTWDKLPSGVKPPLLSVCYNYGHLPQNVAAACLTLNPVEIADAIKAHKGDNKGVNAKRRLAEATYVLKAS